MATSSLQLWLARFVTLVLRAPRAIAALTLLAVVAAAVYLVDNVAVDTNLDDLIAPDTPFRERQRAIQEAFPSRDDSIVVVVQGGSLDARLAAIAELMTRLEERPDVAREVFAPAAMPFFSRHALLYGEPEELEARLDRLAGAQPFLARLAADARPETLVDLLAEGLERDERTPAFTAALTTLRPVLAAAAAGVAEPIAWLQLTDAATATRPLLADVRPVLDFTRLRPAGTALDEVRQLAAKTESAHPGVGVALTGKVALAAEELEAASRGATLAGAVSFVLVAFVLTFGLQTAGGVAAVILTLAAGLILTGAFAMATVGSFTMISIAFAVLFVGLGVDFAIHVALRAREELARTRAWPEAIVAGAAGAGPPLLLCAPTTALAFLSFTPTGYVGLAQLGFIAAAGMIIALVLSLMLLPDLLLLLARPRELVAASLPTPPRRLTRAVALALALAGLALLPLAADVRFDGDPLALKQADAPSVTAFRALLAEPDLSPYHAELLVADAAAARAATARLEAVPEVGRVVGIDRFVPDDQEPKLALLDDARFFLDVPEPRPAPPAVAAELAAALERLAGAALEPELREAAAALAERVRAQPDFAADLQDAWFRYWPRALDRLGAWLAAGPIDAKDLPAALRDRYVAADGRQRLEILPAEPVEDPAERRVFADAVLAVAPDAAGNVVQMTKAADLVARAMLQATALACVGVGLLVALALRRAGDVVAVLMAVLLAASLTLGVMALLDLPFNFANVIVLPLLLGFGVDAAIHVVMRRRETHDLALIGATSTPRAILLSALTTLASFGTLMLSPHAGTASMGLLLTVAMLANLAATLIALPAWLDWRRNS